MITEPKGPGGLTSHVFSDHRHSVRAARESGAPDHLIMLAHDLGQEGQGCNDRPGEQSINTTPSDNMLTLAAYLTDGWSGADLARVLVAHQQAPTGVSGTVHLDQVLVYLKMALRTPVLGTPSRWRDVVTWCEEQDWIGEYAQYVRNGHEVPVDSMIKYRIPYRHGRRMTSPPAKRDRWLDLVEIALLREDGTDPEEAIGLLLPFVFDPRVHDVSMVTVYTLVRTRGCEHALLASLAGLNKDEALAYTGDLGTLHAMAALRAA